MNERLFQFIWQFQYFNKTHLKTTSGDEVQIFQQGILNKDQGPDFKEAKIKIGNTTFAGSVELHLKTSDWSRHGHSLDKNYSNVILHVVFENDLPSQSIPVLELQPHISSVLISRYGFLMDSSTSLACAASLQAVRDITWTSWKERLLVERLTRKSEKVMLQLQETQMHWEETFWWLLARSFGSKVNGESFEGVARSVPVSTLAKHKNQIHQLEALLLGQAGLLNGDFDEDYPKLLQREYKFLKQKYSLQPIFLPMHFLRMRPGNFPTVRLAQLAALIQNATHLFTKILESNSVDDIKKMFEVTANDYWHYHYNFDSPSAFKKKTIGNEMVKNIIINTIVPVVFAYGNYHNQTHFKDKALLWLQQLSSEDNSIIKEFDNLKVSAASAFDTQALIELKNEYCQKKRCLECAIGNTILKTWEIRPEAV